jgi:hypothetical protein
MEMIQNKKGFGPIVLIIVIPIVLVVEIIAVSTLLGKENLEQRQLLEASLIFIPSGFRYF